MNAHQLWFRSTLFEIEPGEDEETNPLCFGRQLARWLRQALIAQGYFVEEPIPKDWGWCLAGRPTQAVLALGRLRQCSQLCGLTPNRPFARRG